MAYFQYPPSQNLQNGFEIVVRWLQNGFFSFLSQSSDAHFLLKDRLSPLTKIRIWFKRHVGDDELSEWMDDGVVGRWADGLHKRIS